MPEVSTKSRTVLDKIKGQNTRTMEKLRKAGLVVTSYETDEDGEENAILTHIFWGDTLKEAIGYAKSHLLTDYFFSSTFTGRMQWQDSELILSYDSYSLGVKEFDEKDEKSLSERAKDVNKRQIEAGINEVIAEVANE